MSETPLWQKIIPIAGIVTLIIVLLIVVKWQHNLLISQKDVAATEMKQLRDDIVRSQSQQASKKDIEAFASNSNIDLNPIRDDLSRINAEIKGIQNVTVRTPGYVGKNLPSSSVVPREGSIPTVFCPGTNVECPDTYGYMSNGQVLKLTEPTTDKKEIPFGDVQFKAWERKPWNLRILPRNYSVTSVMGEDEDGKRYAYHKFVVNVDGKTYPISIDDAKLIEEKPESKFRFNPSLYFGLDFGSYVYPGFALEVMPNIQISLFSYGKTKINPDWTFLGLGLGFGSQTETLGFVLTPFRYNVARHLPMVKNLYLGPTVSVNSVGGFAIMAGIAVGF